jgi:hypothetical protein
METTFFTFFCRSDEFTYPDMDCTSCYYLFYVDPCYFVVKYEPTDDMINNEEFEVSLKFYLIINTLNRTTYSIS